MKPLFESVILLLSTGISLLCPFEAYCGNSPAGFSLVVIPPPSTIVLGEPVYLAAELRYDGSNEVDFMWSESMAVLFGKKGEKLDYFQPKENPECQPEVQAQVASGVFHMKKGEKRNTTKVLLHGGQGALWIEAPGQYQLVCEAWIRIKPVKGKWDLNSNEQFQQVRSDVLDIHIVAPAGESARAFREIKENAVTMLLAPPDLGTLSCGSAGVVQVREKEAEGLISKYSATVYADRLRLGLAYALYASGDAEKIKKADTLFDQVKEKNKEYYAIRLEAMNGQARRLAASADEMRRRMDLLVAGMPVYESPEILDYQDVQMGRAGYGEVKINSLRKRTNGERR